MITTNGVPQCFLRLLSILIFLCGSQVFAEGKLTPEKVAKIRTAAEGGDAEAQHVLGKCLTYEMGVKKDLREAFRWFQKSADQDFVSAQYRVGVCYYDGDGIPKNDEKAILWLELAAHGGDTEAKMRLGKIYGMKSHVLFEEYERSYDSKLDGGWRFYQMLSYMWYNLAVSAGNADGKKGMSELSSYMTTKDIETAQEWSSNWKADPVALKEKRKRLDEMMEKFKRDSESQPSHRKA